MPAPITDALKRLDWYKEGNDPELHPCQGSKFHSPRPLRVNAYRMTTGTTMHLCGTCRDNVELYILLHNQSKGSMAWELQRSFGNELRKVAGFILKNSASPPK